MVNRTRILSIAGAVLSLALVGYVIYQGSLALDEQKENLLNSDFYGWGLAALLFTTYLRWFCLSLMSTSLPL